MPLPNNYEVGDGLNTAGYRWVRHEKDGSEGIFPTNLRSSAPTFTGRKQINTKIDHNFNTKNKLGASYTYERSAGNASALLKPGRTAFEAVFSAIRRRCRSTSHPRCRLRSSTKSAVVCGAPAATRLMDSMTL